MFKNELNRCYKCQQLLFKRFFNNHNNSEILSDIFGLTASRANLFVERNRLKNRDGELIMNSIKFCRKLGYTDEEILDTPTLLRTHPLELEQHYLTLEEGGFKHIGPKILGRARNYMRRMIKTLKLNGVISDTTNVPRKFLEYIENVEIAKKIPLHNFCVDDKWNQIHKSILEEFLRLRLNTTQDEIMRLFRIHRMIKNKSFRVVQENISLAEELGFEPNKILKYGYLLHNYPKYPKTVLNDFPDLAGADMRKAMRAYPKLVMTSPTNIIKIYGILKDFDIEDEVIRKQMNVFHMSPDTVRLRLEEIERSPDFKVFLKNPKLLSLIVHHNRAKSRLSFLQQLKLRCASLIILNTDNNEVFNDYVREGKDVNKHADVKEFLKNLFGATEDEIRDKMKCHPYYLQVPLKDMQNTYNYLINHHFERSDIFNTMPILLYHQEKIRKALNLIKINDEVPSKHLAGTKKLNLVLYFIEKEHHFTGNGIWRKFDIEAGTPDTSLE